MTERARAILRKVLLNLAVLVMCLPMLLWNWVAPAPWHALWMIGSVVLYPQCLALPAALRRFRDPVWRPLQRMTLKEADAAAVGILFLGMLGLMCLTMIDGLARIVRLRTSMDPVLAFLLGMATYLPLVLAFAYAARRTLGPLAASRDFLQRMRRLIPRDRKGRNYMTVVLLCNPFTEELAYRGILVFLLATFVGVVPAALFGLAACLSGHLYQGPRGLPFHAAFYVLVLCILLSEGGMWGAFGLHFAGDLVPWLRVPGELRKLRALRAARAAAHPGPRVGPGAEPAAG